MYFIIKDSDDDPIGPKRIGKIVVGIWKNEIEFNVMFQWLVSMSLIGGRYYQRFIYIFKLKILKLFQVKIDEKIIASIG